MILKPRVFAAPHLSGPIGAAGLAQACEPYGTPGQCGYCQTGFSCAPHGSDCVDTSYCGGTLAIVGVVTLIAGPMSGSA